MFEKYLFRLRSKSPGKVIVHWLYRWYKAAFVVLFLVVLGLGFWEWYYNTARYSWTDDQKKKFWEEYANEIDFKVSRFDSVIAELDARAAKQAENREVERDIFQLKEPKIPEPPVEEAPPVAAPVSTGVPLQD